MHKLSNFREQECNHYRCSEDQIILFHCVLKASQWNQPVWLHLLKWKKLWCKTTVLVTKPIFSHFNHLKKFETLITFEHISFCLFNFVYFALFLQNRLLDAYIASSCFHVVFFVVKFDNIRNFLCYTHTD